MSGFRVESEGFKEIRAGLAKIDRKIGGELAKANKNIGEMILRDSERRRSQMAARFPSYRSGIVRTKASPSRSQVEVTVVPGAAESGTLRHPVFGQWMDQVRFSRLVWPLPDREGWMVRPTVVAQFNEISEEYLEAVAGLARDAIGD